MARTYTPNTGDDGERWSRWWWCTIMHNVHRIVANNHYICWMISYFSRKSRLAFLASFFLRCAINCRISDAVMFRFKSRGPPPLPWFLLPSSCKAISLMEECEERGESVTLSGLVLLVLLLAPLLSDDGVLIGTSATFGVASIWQVVKQ